MIESSWLTGLAGGLLIGVAGTLLLVGNGRIMGVSGILGSLLDGSARGEVAERIAFVLGLIGLPLLLAWQGILPGTHAIDSWPWLIAAGLLVGIGTRVGSGCTSGHGVCGISRLSIRSIVATVSFMAAGAIVVGTIAAGLR